MPLPNCFTGFETREWVRRSILMTTHLIQLAIMNTESSFDLRHHGDAETASGLVDLAVNVRTTEMPTWLRERLSSLNAFAPPIQSRVGHELLLLRHGRGLEEVLLTNGAAEAFVLIARSLNPTRVTRTNRSDSSAVH